ncbi:MAG: NfeD family protein [Tepidiformaceae bacterium]
MLGYVLAAAALIVLGLYHFLPAWIADSAAGVVVAAGIVSFVRTVRQVNHITGAMGTAALIGKEAVARTPLAPKGFVVIHGERWAAEIEDGAVAAGDSVYIVSAEGFCLKVRKGPPLPETPAGASDR